MRLIRLTGEDPDGIISNDFQQDIIITPQSKIALKSLSCEVKVSSIDIDSANDTINYQVQSSQGTLTAQLEHVSYDNISAPSLFADMNLKMNAQLRTVGANVGKNIGLEIRNQIRNDRRFETAMKQARLEENQSNLVLDKGTLAVDRTGASNFGVFQAPTGQTPNSSSPYNCFFYDPNPIARGGGVVRFKTNIMGNTTDNFIIGLTSTNPDTLTGNTFNESNLDFAIVGLQSSLDYGVILSGSASAPLLPVTPNYQGAGNTNNDDLVISIDQGKVVGYIYQHSTGSSPGANLLFEANYNFPNDLYPVVIFLGDSTHSSIRLFRYTESPFNTDPSTLFIEEDLAEGKLNAPPTQSRNPTNCFLEFEGSTLSNFLGFDTNRTPADPTKFERANDFIVIANDRFRPNALSDAFLVELLNIQLKSYDGLSGQRKSYISVIPESDADGVILYDANYPIFIDIENTQPLTLRNFKARILNNDGSSISQAGLTSIVLLIEDGEKKPFRLTE